MLDGLELAILKDTLQNFQTIETLKESDTKLIQWKDDFFQTIQLIQDNSDSKNYESFYRQIVNVIKELSGYLEVLEEISEINL